LVAKKSPVSLKSWAFRTGRGWARSGGNIDKAIEANARIQAELLRTSSPVIRDAIKAGELKVEAAIYDVATGKVTVT
jgi:carbonic anhydrase